MNLLEFNNTPINSLIGIYRSYQYNKIDYLLDLGIRYLNNLGLQVDSKVYPNISGILKTKDSNYTKINHFDTTQYKIKIIDDKQNWFLVLSIPNLIDGVFFKLNQSYYIPILYIIDEPIVVKEESIKLDSLFQPISLYFKNRTVTFLGESYWLSDFFDFMTYYWDVDTRKNIESLLDIKFTGKLQSIIDIFANKLNCLQDYDVIKNKINLLFFDEWTSDLYKKYYNIETFDDILMTVLYKRYDQVVNDQVYKFNDLRHKRLIFIEMLLKPYFKNISLCAKLLLKNNVILNSKMKIKDIIDHFFSTLNGNSLYDTVNGFSGILTHKATFKNPFGSGELPKEVSSIHWTHKNRICPNSISNHDSGQDVFLVPNQQIDLDYGMFSFTEEEMNYPS